MNENDQCRGHCFTLFHFICVCVVFRVRCTVLAVEARDEGIRRDKRLVHLRMAMEGKKWEFC